MFDPLIHEHIENIISRLVAAQGSLLVVGAPTNHVENHVELSKGLQEDKVEPND